MAAFLPLMGSNTFLDNTLATVALYVIELTVEHCLLQFPIYILFS